ncbi:MAG: hypothetical protein HQL45_15585 [Alphaproteobacteria bacterium]|nr:hypothetical protein [Alphaproteobacteria bacterium]
MAAVRKGPPKQFYGVRLDEADVIWLRADGAGRGGDLIRTAINYFRRREAEQIDIKIPGEREYAELRQLVVQIRKIGVNLNQLVVAARMAARSEEEPRPDFDEIEDVIDQLKATHDALLKITKFWQVRHG